MFLIKSIVLSLLMFGEFAMIQAQESTVIQGKVVDDVGAPIEFANVYMDGENLGTVTNDQGEFLLKIPSILRSAVLKVSFIGYTTQQFPINEIDGALNIHLEQDAFVLNAVDITPFNALEIIHKAIEKIPENHYSFPLKQEGFYRGLTYFEDSIVQLEESAVNIYKVPMTSANVDKAELIKRRFIQDQQAFENLRENLGGHFGFGASVNSFLAQDIVKKYDDYKLLSDKSLKHHVFELEEIKSLYDGAVYVISFEPKKRGWMNGVLYIDTASLAFAGIDAAVSEQYKSKNKLFPIHVKIALNILNIFPVIHDYNFNVTYEPIEGQWYMKTGEINIDLSLHKKGIENKIRFHVIYNISSHHKTTLDEIAVLKSNNDKDYFKSRTDDGDDDFWKDYNIIKQSSIFQSEFERIRAKNVLYQDEIENDQ